ncbi:MAG: hypothetical protein J7578_07680 [Chitinophagaceae bacterium]|nr:hypothetical protein [Chitinophagaceae bacterium]
MNFNIQHTMAALLLTLSVLSACKKEATPAPSHKDENYLVVKDNPADPVDHRIFQFFENTGIPCFYNDTVAKVQVGISSTGVPQYSFQRLVLSYSPLGSIKSQLFATKNKQYIPAILDLLKSELVPKLPAGIFIPSILFVDSLTLGDFFIDMDDPAVGWDAVAGFNTVAIRCRDVASMNADEKRLYIANIITGVVVNKMMSTQNTALQKDFYSISRALAKPELGDMDVYNSFPLEFFLPALPEPGHYALMRFLPYKVQFDDLVIYYTVPPREEEDLKMFLVAVLYYTTQEFNTKYDQYPAIKDKFRILGEIATAAGLQLPR